jgi:glutamine amidotransferase
MIVIVDYGMGNLRSVEKALIRLGQTPIVSNSIEKILQANKLILPGVGHFKQGMENLYKLNLIDILNKKVLLQKTPVLGICLGMQLMTKFSEEGNTDGLGWLDSYTKKFEFQNKSLKVPHMGWNTLKIKKQSSIVNGISDVDIFYFVHSFFVSCTNTEDIVTTTNYGVEFVSVIQKDNLFATQFHPEKSHEAGLRIIENFLKS